VRCLTSGLIAEDASDAAFLVPVLQAELTRIGWDAEFEALDIQSAEVTTVMSADSVARAAANLLDCSDLLFVHQDVREAAKIDRLRAKVSDGRRIVSVVPIRETEAWVLAAVIGTGGIEMLDTAPPEKGCRWVERLADPKAELRRRYRGRRSTEDLFTLIAERADLDGLAEVPAYQSFLQDLTKALKELNFL
jgi:hypothetical protein